MYIDLDVDIDVDVDIAFCLCAAVLYSVYCIQYSVLIRSTVQLYKVLVKSKEYYVGCVHRRFNKTVRTCTSSTIR